MRTAVLMSALALSLPLGSSAWAEAPPPDSAGPAGAQMAEAFAALPDAPGRNSALDAAPGGIVAADSTPPCRSVAFASIGTPEADSADDSREPCLNLPNPYKRFLDTTIPVPLTPMQKAHLALHNLKDPGNLATIVGTSAYSIGTDAHTAYGPGWKGFGRSTGYSLLQDSTGEFFGTFLIPSLAHEDPHYHRMPHASIPRRILHAALRTVVAQADDGHLMPNFSNLLTNPFCAEISNLYVPGVNGNARSTTARILTGYATDPIDTEITEFLPDIASHIHIHVIFVQRILNQVASGQPSQGSNGGGAAAMQ